MSDLHSDTRVKSDAKWKQQRRPDFVVIEIVVTCKTVLLQCRINQDIIQSPLLLFFPDVPNAAAE